MSENVSTPVAESDVKTVEVNVADPTNQNEVTPPEENNTPNSNNPLSGIVEAEVLRLLTEVHAVNDDELRQKNTELLTYLGKLIQLLKDKSSECTHLEKQNTALLQQSKSLKEVVAIVKDLLNIRNMELSHLQQDISSMQEKINNERTRHNTMIEKMEHVAKLNKSLKEEYAKQYGNFQNVRTMYEEKIAILVAENQRLQNISTNTNTNEQNMNEVNERLNNISLALEAYPPFDDSANDNVEK